MSTFVITKRKDGEFQFNLKAGNGEIILTSEGYSSKQGCTNGIESVMKNATDDNRYEQKTASNGKYYFVLTATNGQVIGTSQMYETAAGRDGGIDAVKRNAPSATIDDQTL
jgi:uncharacterized protein YegP (UPF0339 family)